ncbi:MAG: cadherin-like domain-containing protein [Anaerolineae bacterium]
MEQIIVAVILIFLLLFGVLTLTNALLQAQSTLEVSWEEMNSRASQDQNTAISPVGLRILNAGSEIEVTIRNSGATKLADYDRWDVFVEYTEGDAESPVYHAGRLAYDSAAPASNEWTDDTIYIDKDLDIPESYETGIFNPGEQLTLLLNVSPAVGVGQGAHVTVSTENGIATSLVGTRNIPPTLTLNTGVKIPAGGGAVITSDMLLADDPDNEPEDLVYTVVTPPATGTLTLDDPVSPTPITEFTQAQIDARKIVYTHIGSEPDSFTFTLSDGIDTVDPLPPFTITLDATPMLETPYPMISLPALTSRTITNADLRTSDADDTSDTLVYTVTQLPSDGFLSCVPMEQTAPVEPCATFTQAQIDAGKVSYRHTGTDADMFKFIVSDGYDVIGANVFLITLST